MNLQDLINKSTRYVTATLKEYGIVHRTVEISGHKLIVSRDVIPERVNLVFANDRLVSYTYG